MTIKEECEGCRSSYTEGGCYSTPFKEHSLCPCATCLVKGMCGYPCDEFIAHQNIVSDIR